MEHIDITEEIKNFRNHLSNNNRTILSARFGDGKSYMLKAFTDKYSKELYDEELCYFITLHPVNYSVAPNDDVFEYIKRDILLQMANDHLLDNVDFDAIYGSIINKDNFYELIDFFGAFIPNGEFYAKLIKKVCDKCKEYNEQKQTFSKYNSVFHNTKGGLYEEDSYTKLIRESLNWKKKSNKNGKKIRTILIIEDLDRIDPAHLFRILNVLSAHVDEDSSCNKFGFDNIVLVLDYDTTKHIYHYFYGSQANYDGYMSKFFSKNIFHYSIDEISRKVFRDCLLKKFKIPEDFLNINIALKGYPADIGSDVLLGSCINKLSVRDVVRIIDDIESQFSAKTINIPNFADITAFAPITYLLAILVRMNVYYNTEIIVSNIKRSGMPAVKLMGVFMLVNPDIQSGQSFRDESENYYSISYPDDMTSDSIEHIDIISNSIALPAFISLDKMLEKSFDSACSVVRDLNVRTHF